MSDFEKKLKDSAEGAVEMMQTISSVKGKAYASAVRSVSLVCAIEAVVCTAAAKASASEDFEAGLRAVHQAIHQMIPALVCAMADTHRDGGIVNDANADAFSADVIAYTKRTVIFE